MARKRSAPKKSRKRRSAKGLRPKSLKGLKGGLRKYWAARGVK